MSWLLLRIALERRVRNAYLSLMPKEARVRWWMRQLLANYEDSLARLHLEWYGAAAVPEIIKALRDGGGTSAPTTCLLELLSPVLSAEAEQTLVSILPRVDETDVARCVSLLCRLGSAEAFRAIESQLRLLPDSRAEQAESGLGACTRHLPSGYKPENAQRVFDLLASRIDGCDERRASHLIEILLCLDEERALRRLDELGYMELRHPRLKDMLCAIRRLRLTLPEPLVSRFKEWLDLPEEQISGKPNGDVRRWVLPALARTEPAVIERMARERLKNGVANADWGDSDALVVAAGVENAYERVSCIVHRQQPDGSRSMHFDELTPPQRTCYLAFRVDAEVSNGGFSQYFENTSACYSALAPAALREIGAPRRGDMVQRALDAVGVTTAPADRDLIRTRLEAQQVRTTLANLDGEYYADPIAHWEPVLPLLKVYAADHREHFTGPWPEGGYIVG